jgi:hypothetical protein
MTPVEKIEGLCSTCDSRFHCRILKQSQAQNKVIWHCEEFSGPDHGRKEEEEKKHPVVMSTDNLIPGWNR